MTRTSLAERQARLEQQRVRLQLEENRVREAERKARVRRLIEAGGLVDKAGLLGLDANALYGALLNLAERRSDPAEVARWEARGGRAFVLEAQARAVEKEPLILSLDGAQAATVTARLRTLGFRWSKVMRHWEGLASFEAAKLAADELGGTLRRVAAESRGGLEVNGDTDAETEGGAVDATGATRAAE